MLYTVDNAPHASCKMLSIISLLGFASAAAGASSAYAQAPEVTEILTPTANVAQPGIVGLDLLKSEIAISAPGIRTTQGVQKRVFTALYSVQAYEPLKPTSSKSKLKACAADGLGVCLFDDDGDGTFDRIAEDLVSPAYKVDQPVPYERVNITDPNSRIVRHLTLASIQGRELTLHYHEEFARPGAFAADDIIRVAVPDELPAVIKIREFSIQILTLQDGKMTYSLVPPKPFPKFQAR